MTLAFFLALATAATVGVLLLPLLRRGGPAAARFDHEIEIHRDRLAEIERERSAGALDEDAARAARLEIERRILAAAEAPHQAAAAPTERKLLPVAVAALVPLLALGAYFSLGRPELPAQPFAERPAPPADPDPGRLERRIAELREAVARAPADLEARLELARLLILSGRAADSVRLLRETAAAAPGRADVLSALGEALTMEADGTVTPEARAAFAEVERRDRADVRAQFYLGRAEEQGGDGRAALVRWLDLEARSPEDAPWMATLRAEIARVAKALRIDPQSIRPDRRVPGTSGQAVPPGPGGPSHEDAERLARLPPAEREAAIRGMVEGLETRLKDSPDDLAGWLRLGGAWNVLGEPARAAEALRRADQLKPGDPRILADLAEALLRTGDPAKPPDEATIAVLRRLEAARPDSGLALFYLGEAALAAGDRDGALARFRRLLAMMPAGEPARAAMERRIGEIEAGR